MVFEHLGNLKPCRGKYSRRSNQKRAYWLKSKVFNQTKDIAYRDYGILTTRVNPRNTSRFDPWGNPLWRGNKFPNSLLDYYGAYKVRSSPKHTAPKEYQPGASLVANTAGYKAHSGLNASRNIGLKAIGRHRTNPHYLRGKPEIEITQVYDKT